MVIFIEGCLEPNYGPRVTVDDIADHIDYIRNIAGVESVGLGKSSLQVLWLLPQFFS